MIFNPQGHSAKQFGKFKFYIDGRSLTIADSYVYLGLVFKPSGAVSAASQELLTKANKAWFAISNTVYQNKKMSITKALQLVDSLVTPISLYACEFWTPYSIPTKYLNNSESLLKFWENFLPETLNQRICRMLLSVHKKSSCLAVIGEIARYPFFLKALIQSLKYDWHLRNENSSSLVQSALYEMDTQAHQGNTNWSYIMDHIKKLLSIPKLHYSLPIKKVGKLFTKYVHSHFESFYLQQINKQSIGEDGLDHNKLRFYKHFKGSFTREPYLNLTVNRNQRSSLTRLRISAHHLALETGRWRKPKPIPLDERVCRYCSSGLIDDEKHFLLKCNTFRNKTRCFESKLSSLIPWYNSLADSAKLATILCPTSGPAAKLANKYINILFKARTSIDNGEHISNLTFPPNIEHFSSDEFDLSNMSHLTTSDSDLSLSDNSSTFDEIDIDCDIL